MTSYIVGSLDDRIMKNKAIFVALEKIRKGKHKPNFFAEPGTDQCCSTCPP